MMNTPEINRNEPPQEFFNKTTGERWRREGYCCQCGDCCIGDFETGEGDGPCPLLKRMTADKAICSDRQHWYYLRGCNVWPSKPEHIKDLPRCTYKFTKLK